MQGRKSNYQVPLESDREKIGMTLASQGELRKREEKAREKLALKETLTKKREAHITGLITK